MASRIKDKGAQELSSYKRRVLNVRALERISKADADWLVEHVEEIQRYVSRMTELPDREKEFR